MPGIRILHRNPCNDLILFQVGSFRIDLHSWMGFDYWNRPWIWYILIGFLTFSIQKGPGKRYE